MFGIIALIVVVALSIFKVSFNRASLPTMVKQPSETTLTSLPDQSKLPNKLVITRPEDTKDRLFALTKIITDEVKVRKLFNDIYLLPVFDPHAVYTCPLGNPVKYLLDFYQDDSLIAHGTYNPTGCAAVKLDNNPAKNDGVHTFGSELQQILGLSDKKFYGYPQ